MKRHMLMRWVSLIVLLSALLNSSGPVEAKRSQPGGFRVAQSNERGIILSLSVPVEQIAFQQVENFDKVTLPDFDTTTDPGKPQLPVYHALIGVPPGAQVSLSILQDVTQIFPGKYNLSLAPAPAPLKEDLTPGQWQSVVSPLVASTETVYPPNLAEVSRDAWLRDWHFVRLSLYPLQYDALQGRVTLHSYLEVSVDFIGGDSLAVSATPSGQDSSDPIDSMMQESLLNYDVARNWKGQKPVSNLEQTAVSGQRYKITVDRDGLYRVTYADLQSAGMNVAAVDPRTFHLSSQGDDVSIYVAGEDDGSFDPSDYIIFNGQQFYGDRLAAAHPDEDLNWITYTEQLTNGVYTYWHPQFNATMAEKYTNDNVYWLTEGGAPGPRMAEVNGDPTGSTAPTPAVYRTTVHAERSTRWWTWHFTDEDTWYWEVVTNNTTRFYTTTLTSVASGAYTATIRGEVVAMNTNDNLPNDHHTRVSINNDPQPVDEAYWEGKSRYRFEGQAPQSSLVEGVNSLKFTYLPDGATPPPIYFDWFEIEYDRRFLAAGNQIAFTGEHTGEWQYALGNFSSASVEVYDVTDPLDPMRVLNPVITSSGGVYTATFEINQAAGSQYLAVAPQAILSPKAITFYDPPDLKSASNGADYIVITHPAFLTPAQALADFHTAQGLRTLVVDINDVFNEFGEGIYHPIAIKNFLAYAYSVWQSPAPVYVVLIGDSTWNFKVFNPARYGSEPTYLPANLGFVDPWQGEVDATNQLATIVGSDPLPDVYMSRIPASSVAEATAVVNKIIGYAGQPSQDWQRNLAFVSDNIPDDAGDFQASAEALINNFVAPGFQPNRVYETDYCPPTDPPTPCPAATHALTETFNVTGTLLMSFVGHGAPQRWTHENLLTNDVAVQLTNGGQLPVILSMTCMDGYWIGPHGPQYVQGPSLVEALINGADKGAVSTFSPGGLGLSTGHDALADGFYGAIFDTGIWQLGPATVAARLGVFATGNDGDLINTYNIFGDPALRLHSPYDLTLNPPLAAQSAMTGDVVTYTLSLANTSAITDTFDVTLGSHAWTTSAPAAVGPLPPGDSVSLLVEVQIPTGLSGGATDVVQVTATSRGDISKTASAQLTTTADVYGLSLRPAVDSRTALPGATVTYTLQLTNTSNTADTFDIAAGAHTWPVNAPISTGSLGPGDSAELIVTVEIPISAQDYQSETLVISATSQADPLRLATSTLTTTTRLYDVSLAPTQISQSGLPNTQIVYHLQLTNTGGYSDSFDLDVAGNQWATTIIPPSLGPLLPDQAAPVTVTVNIPSGALGGVTDVVTVTAASTGYPALQAQSILMTTSNVFGVDVTSAATAQTGAPGSSVFYNLRVWNLGSASDQFDISMGTYAWQTDAPLFVGPIAPGGSESITVMVTIPSGAVSGSTDSVTLNLASAGDPNQVANITLTTTARPYGVTVTADTTSQDGNPGGEVIYSLQVTNISVYTDTFTVLVSGPGWPTNPDTLTIGPLGPGDAVTLLVTVQIPADALSGSSDVATVKVVSWGYGSQSAQVVLTTTALISNRVYLPIVIR